jgi:glycosyltransferase involved in cell wall biosynthesis
MSGQARIPAFKDYATRAGTARLSIVTAVRNGGKTLGRTIASVRAQNIPGLEYVIVDAVSTDDTLGVIRANADIVSFWKSEPDRGISDGFNKGIALSTGTYVSLLNTDDWLLPGQLSAGLATLESSGADFVFGDLVYHDAQGVALHRVRGEADYANHISHGMPALNHPTIIMRRDAYERLGLFDIGLRYAMDYELLLRFHRAGCRGVYEPRMTGAMSLGGASDLHVAAALREVREISIRHGYSAVTAHLLYGFRLVKTRARGAAELLLPRAASVMLRRLFNRWVTPV